MLLVPVQMKSETSTHGFVYVCIHISDLIMDLFERILFICCKYGSHLRLEYVVSLLSFVYFLFGCDNCKWNLKPF